MRIAILYASDEGQTEKIAHYIGAGLRRDGHEVTLTTIKDLSPDFQLGDFNKVLIGASIHMSNHQRYVVKWVSENLNALQHVPNAFFSVSMAASDMTVAGQSEVQGYLKSFVKQTGWIPDHVAPFAGALKFNRYGFFKRLLMLQLVRIKRLDIDTSRDTEFTDWRKVDEFITSQSMI
jgi:menaquinone-dependent protoporphyrinogen oxidase